MDIAELEKDLGETNASLGSDYTYRYIDNGEQHTKLLVYKEKRNDNTYRFDFLLNYRGNITHTFDSRNGEEVLFKIPSRRSGRVQKEQTEEYLVFYGGKNDQQEKEDPEKEDLVEKKNSKKK